MVYEHIPGRPRINITSANEHVPEIEGQIRVFKKITRAVRQSLTLNKTPNLLAIYIVFTVVRMLNYFPFKHMPRGARINLTSSNEHVPEIERQIRVFK